METRVDYILIEHSVSWKIGGIQHGIQMGEPPEDGEVLLSCGRKTKKRLSLSKRNGSVWTEEKDRAEICIQTQV